MFPLEQELFLHPYTYRNFMDTFNGYVNLALAWLLSTPSFTSHDPPPPPKWPLNKCARTSTNIYIKIILIIITNQRTFHFFYLLICLFAYLQHQLVSPEPSGNKHKRTNWFILKRFLPPITSSLSVPSLSLLKDTKLPVL